MKEAKFFGGNADLQRSRIRSRYRGIDPDLLEVIPAKPTEGLHDDSVHRRVAVYARVSTDDPRQTSSYELQKNYYEDYISRYPNWELVHIYADEGISGTSLRHRDSFNQMINDCAAGKIDLIITKSVAMLNLYNKKGSANGTLKWAKLYENKQVIYNQSIISVQSQLTLEETE